MKKTTITLIILLVILAGIISYLYFNLGSAEVTGEAIINSYTYTKAICDKENYCQDYVITCENGELVNQNPITGAAVQKSSDWEDPREDKELC